MKQKTKTAAKTNGKVAKHSDGDKDGYASSSKFHVGDIVFTEPPGGNFGVVEHIHHNDLIVRHFCDTDGGGMYSNTSSYPAKDCWMAVDAEELEQIRRNAQPPSGRW